MLAVLLVRLSGALGKEGGIGITAPEPAEDSIESPIVLIAITLALTYTPIAKLNGDTRSTATGILQDLLAMTDELLPLQLAVSCDHVPEDVSM